MNSSIYIQNKNEILMNLFKINKKRYRVLLNSEKITWENNEKNKNDKVEVSICDIIAVEYSVEKRNLIKCLRKNNNNSINVDDTVELNFAFNSINTFPSNNKYSETNVIASQNLELNKENQLKELSLPSSSINQSLPTSSGILSSTLETIDEINNDKINYDIPQSNKSQYLILNYAKRKKNSKTHYNRWYCKTISLCNNNTYIIMKWYNFIKNLLNKEKRPKSILLFINPFSGKRNCLKMYNKLCKPLFKLANINIVCIITQKSKQIYDILMEQNISQYDSICCIGGDGTFSELFNGLIYRTMKDNNINYMNPKYIPKPNIPIGIIPGGSTNTIVYCLHGTCDIITSTLHIILGQKRGLDLASVYNINGLIKFYASVISYGYLGDIALDSENFRWMGPKRYDYTGIKKFLANRSYYGDISFLSSEIQMNENISSTSNKSNNSKTTDENNSILKIKKPSSSTGLNLDSKTFPSSNTGAVTILKNENTNDNEKSTTKCYVNCLTCTNSLSSLISSNSQANNDGSNTENKFELNYMPRFKYDKGDNGEDGDFDKGDRDDDNHKYNKILFNLLRHADIGNEITIFNNDDCNDNNDNRIKETSCINEGYLEDENDEILNQDDFELNTHDISKNVQLSTVTNNRQLLNNIKGNFFLISGANVSCSCERSPNGWSQFSHLGDGYLDLILVRHTTFFNNLRLLMAMTKRNGNISNLPFVELHRTKKFLFRAKQNCKNNKKNVNNTSQWNCDGEIIYDTDLIVSSHCQLIDVFMRGPYPKEIRDNKKTVLI